MYETYNVKTVLIRLRIRRVELGMKQSTVCRRLNKYQSWISKIETGVKKLDVSELYELAKLYRKDVREFI